MVIGLVIWISISVVVVLLCLAARRIDQGLGRRTARPYTPAKPEPPSRPRAKVE
jgi:hypothetical protein